MSPVSSAIDCSGGGGVGEIMLFGVRVVVDSMRKSVSMNNLSQYEQPHKSNENFNKEDVAVVVVVVAGGGYVSADNVVHHANGGRERKRGVPWTEEEHKLFLDGLKKIGKGDWRGISRNFVKTRTPTQVASHAQKYFVRRNNNSRRRRRSSIFDITTETVSATPKEEVHIIGHQENASHSHPLAPLHPAAEEACNFSAFSMMPRFPVTVTPAVLPDPVENPIESLTLGQCDQSNNGWMNLIRPIPVLPVADTKPISDLNLSLSSSADPSSSSLSLKLSLPTEQRESSSRYSPFQALSSFNNGDSIISVA